MKKVTVTLFGLMALMLLSFVSPQKAKVVRLENGNYQLQNFKFEKSDAEKMQELAEEMAEWLNPKEDGEINKDDKERPNFEDFLTIYKGKKGVKQYIGAGLENHFTYLAKEVYENVISQTLYHENNIKEKDGITRFQRDIDAIMNPYLNK